MLKNLFGLLILGITYPIFGQYGEWGKVLEVSKSNKSIIFNKGTLNGFSEGEVGFFLTFRDKKLVKVAKGRIVRSLPGRSFWYLSEIYAPEFLDKNLYVFPEKELLRGRKKEGESHTAVVLTPGQTPINQKDIPDKIRYKENEHREGPELSVPPVRSQEELKMKHYTSWLNQGLKAVEEFEDVAEVKTIKGIKGQKTSERIQRERKEDTALSTLDGLLSDKIILDKPPVDPKVIRMREREGPLWSADLDDRELRRYMLETGMMEEKERQEFAMENRFMDELLFNFVLEVSNNTAQVSTQNMANPYALSLGYEYHLMRISRSIDSFTFSLLFEGGVGYYDVGGINARGTEWSFLGNINWYFLSLPSAVSKFMGYVGIGARYGSSDLVANELSTDYPYQIISFPTFQLGFKYRFPTKSGEDGFGWGLNFNAAYLKTKLDVMVNLQDDIYGTINEDEIRLLFGLTFTF